MGTMEYVVLSSFLSTVNRHGHLYIDTEHLSPQDILRLYSIHTVGTCFSLVL